MTSSTVAMVTDFEFIGIYSEKCVSCSAQIIREMLPEIHTLEKCDFLKPINVHSQIFLCPCDDSQGALRFAPVCPSVCLSVHLSHFMV